MKKAPLLRGFFFGRTENLFNPPLFIFITTSAFPNISLVKQSLTNISQPGTHPQNRPKSPVQERDYNQQN